MPKEYSEMAASINGDPLAPGTPSGPWPGGGLSYTPFVLALRIKAALDWTAFNNWDGVEWFHSDNDQAGINAKVAANTPDVTTQKPAMENWQTEVFGMCDNLPNSNSRYMSARAFRNVP